MIRIIALAVACLAVPAASGLEPMSVAQQNELVHKYCAVCHTDAYPRGGLSLEHYDAAVAAPSLAAMMLSKLTNGVSLKTVQSASTDPEADGIVSSKMKRGAMGAAGLPIPDLPVVGAFIYAFAAQAATDKWHVSTRENVTTASIAAEVLSWKTILREAATYRLIVTCDAATGDGAMQLAWSPEPRSGTLIAVADGGAPRGIAVAEGTETMGNGSTAIAGSAAVTLYEGTSMSLPAKTLEFSNLFPYQTATFRFDTLAPETRQRLSACLAD